MAERHTYIPVRRWPTYLLTNIPDGIRAALEKDAEAKDLPMIEIVREILCAHYALDCEPVAGTPMIWIKGTRKMILRLQPAVFSELRYEAQMTSRPMRDVIIGALVQHYELKEVTS